MTFSGPNPRCMVASCLRARQLKPSIQISANPGKKLSFIFSRQFALRISNCSPLPPARAVWQAVLGHEPSCPNPSVHALAAFPRHPEWSVLINRRFSASFFPLQAMTVLTAPSALPPSVVSSVKLSGLSHGTRQYDHHATGHCPMVSTVKVLGPRANPQRTAWFRFPRGGTRRY